MSWYLVLAVLISLVVYLTSWGLSCIKECKKYKKRKRCDHNYEIAERSNVIQYDDMGYPSRLFICKCTKCGKSNQRWIAVTFWNIRDDNVVVLKWEAVEE